MIRLQELELELKNNPLLKNVQFKIDGPESKDVIQKAEDFLEISLTDSFYSRFSSLNFSWEMNEQLNPNLFVCGKANLLSLPNVCINWMDVLYFEEDSALSDFYPIDMPTEETAIGIYKGSTSLHWLYAGEEKTTALHIQLNDYPNFLIETKGFIYWQKAVMACNNSKNQSQESAAYFQTITTLFPNSTEKSLMDLIKNRMTK